MLKPFLYWLVATLVSFGALAGAYHRYLTLHPVRILVVVDSSERMETSRARIEAILSEIASLRYKEILLYTDRSQIHDWDPYRGFQTFYFYDYQDEALKRIRAQEFPEADRIILITNAPENELRDFSGWSIVRP